jgi:hypothetical protein
MASGIIRPINSRVLRKLPALPRFPHPVNPDPSQKLSAPLFPDCNGAPLFTNVLVEKYLCPAFCPVFRI